MPIKPFPLDKWGKLLFLIRYKKFANEEALTDKADGNLVGSVFNTNL